jgi:hypothetical protein
MNTVARRLLARLDNFGNEGDVTIGTFMTSFYEYRGGSSQLKHNEAFFYFIKKTLIPCAPDLPFLAAQSN